MDEPEIPATQPNDDDMGVPQILPESNPQFEEEPQVESHVDSGTSKKEGLPDDPDAELDLLEVQAF